MTTTARPTVEGPPPSPRRPVLRSHLPELAILLLAALIRFWRLDYHSFWFDEAISLRWAASAPEYTWDVTLQLVQEKHPPVYYLLLHYWRQALMPFGLAQNDAALRSLGVLLGVLTVAGVLLAARRLSGRATALLAGTLVALSPVLVWYSQELRMFQPAATAIVWGSWFLLAAWQARRSWARLGWSLAMIAAFEAALYSYLFSAFILPAAGIALIALAFAETKNGTRMDADRRRSGDCDATRAKKTESKAAFSTFAASGSSASHSFPWRRLLEGTVALGVTGVLFLPLARNAWLANASDGTPGQAFMDFVPNLVRQLQIFTTWRVDWAEPVRSGTLIFWGVLLLAGLLVPWVRARTPMEADGRRSGDWDAERAEKTDLKAALSVFAASDSSASIRVYLRPFFSLDQLWLWIWIGVPLFIGNLLLARNDTIFAEDRYFLFLGPFVLWAAARGGVAVAAALAASTAAMQRRTHTRSPVNRAGVAGGAILAVVIGFAAVVVMALALPRLWTPAMLREDWRAAAAYVAGYQDASPGLPAAAVAHVDYTRFAANWYLRQHYNQEELPVFFPFGGSLAPGEVESVIAPPLLGIEQAGVDTLWLLQSHLDGVDEGRLVEGWLNRRYPLITEQYPAGIKLTGYALASQYAALPELAPDARFPGAELAPGLKLTACELVTPVVSATDERMHPPSGWVHVRLWWQATGPLAQDYMPAVQMVGPEGVWGDRLYRDNEPLRRFPTTTWTPGQFVRDEVDVNLNPVTPSGEYPIVVGLRDAGGQEMGVKVECGRVKIAEQP